MEGSHTAGDPTGGRWPSRDQGLAWALLPPYPLALEGLVSWDPLSPSVGAGQVGRPASPEPVLLYGRGSWCPRGGRAGPPVQDLLDPACLSLQDGSLAEDIRTYHAQMGFQGLRLCLPFFQTHVFFYSYPCLVTILVSSSLFSWGGRPHLVLELDSCWNVNLWLIPWAVSAYGNGHNSLPAQSYHFTGDSPFPFQIILEAQDPMRDSRGPGFPWYRAFETTGR